MKKIFTILFLSLISFYGVAGDLIVDAKITKVGSTNNNSNVFFVTTEGGTGPCVGLTIDFPAAVAQSPEAFSREFSLAIAAFTANKRVRIYSYDGNDCKQANFIAMYN